MQLTRLPTTVDQTRSTGAPGVSPVAATSTFERTGPVVELSVAVAARAGEAEAASVVVVRRASARPVTGQSMRGVGRPSSFVTVNVNVAPVPHGIGDCWMFR